MEQGKTLLAASLLAGAALVSSTAQAVVFAEPGDAGQTLTSFANATGAGAAGTGLTGITGTITGLNDADLYSFTLSGTSAVRFSVTSTAGIDTALFLFGPGGVALLANDDSATGFNPSVTLPAGLAAGTYYLGLALSGNEPINTANQLLFALGTPTSTRGAATGTNPNTLGSFNSGAGFDENGAYAISVTNVPEPSTWAALSLGLGTLALAARRKKSAQA